MRHQRALIAVLLSLLVPGLGQMYSGKGERGVAVLVAAVVAAGLNLIFLLLFVLAELEPADAWVYWVPRIGDDVVAAWSLVFWVWAIFDAYRNASAER